MFCVRARTKLGNSNSFLQSFLIILAQNQSQPMFLVSSHLKKWGGEYRLLFRLEYESLATPYTIHNATATCHMSSEISESEGSPTN